MQYITEYENGVKPITGDFNGDGMDDFIRQEKGGWNGDNLYTLTFYLPIFPPPVN